MRVSDLTLHQLEELQSRWNTSKTETITMIIDRAYQQEKHTMNAAQARKLAIETIEHADEAGQPVADTTLVGKDANGYWVTDNGEEVNGLTKEQAIEIIIENLSE